MIDKKRFTGASLDELRGIVHRRPLRLQRPTVAEVIEFTKKQPDRQKLAAALSATWMRKVSLDMAPSYYPIEASLVVTYALSLFDIKSDVHPVLVMVSDNRGKTETYGTYPPGWCEDRQFEGCVGVIVEDMYLFVDPVLNYHPLVPSGLPSGRLPAISELPDEKVPIIIERGDFLIGYIPLPPLIPAPWRDPWIKHREVALRRDALNLASATLAFFRHNELAPIVGRIPQIGFTRTFSLLSKYTWRAKKLEDEAALLKQDYYVQRSNDDLLLRFTELV